MKKIFAIAMLFAAVSMVSCGGNGTKKAAEAEDCCEKTECCEKAECGGEEKECCGCCEKAEGEACQASAEATEAAE